MFIKFGLPAASFAMLVMTIGYVVRSAERDELQSPPTQPPTSPFAATVAAAGIVEAQSEDIEIGAPVSGIVAEVYVEVGGQVRPGDPLFRLDDRQLQSLAESRRAELACAQAEYEHLIAGARNEEISVAESNLARATAQWGRHRDQMTRIEKLYKEHAVTEQSFVEAGKETEIAAAEVTAASAKLDLLRNGASETEKKVAAADVRRAEARLNETLADLERLTVRACEPATVLQVNLHAGEHVGAPAASPLLILGNVETLHVRVDVDEFEIPRFQRGAAAAAVLKGHPERRYPLRFVRVERRVVPKRSLTGYGSERIDTRVLQVIYAVEPEAENSLYVGQQVDVYIDAEDQNAHRKTHHPEQNAVYANH
mgnify:CR=1 FL=1